MVSKKQFVWFGIYVVGLVGMIFATTPKPSLLWFIVRFISICIFGGLMGYLIAEAGRATYYKKIVDKIYEQEKE